MIPRMESVRRDWGRGVGWGVGVGNREGKEVVLSGKACPGSHNRMESSEAPSRVRRGRTLEGRKTGLTQSRPPISLVKYC